MWTVSFLLLVLTVSVETLVCRIGEQPCGSNGCFNPTTQRCIDETDTIECLNSCNGTCYSNSQYCYDNTKICNNTELVCDVKNYSRIYFPLGLACYDPSQYSCLNNRICPKEDVCGTQCLNRFSLCVDNQTITCSFAVGGFNPGVIGICGPQKQCYFTTDEVCLNRATVCRRGNQRLCGTTCYNPDLQTCVNRNVQCLNSCNGTCYQSWQYCYDNTIICNRWDLVCDVKIPVESFSVGRRCYDPSQLSCFDDKLCYTYSICGTQCMDYYFSVCVNNQTICRYEATRESLFFGISPKMNVCGPQQQCYDEKKSVCLNGTTVCEGLDAQLCGTNCFRADRQTCINGTVQCLNSCNGTCYPNSQYCFKNATICNNSQSGCDVKTSNDFLGDNGRILIEFAPFGPTCYDSSVLNCLNDSLCYDAQVCGTQCLNDQYSVCVNNETICYGFFYEHPYNKVCGPQQKCYDSSINVCLGDGIVCPIGNQLCSGECYNPELEYCIIDDSTTGSLSTGTGGD